MYKLALILSCPHFITLKYFVFTYLTCVANFALKILNHGANIITNFTWILLFDALRCSILDVYCFFIIIILEIWTSISTYFIYSTFFIKPQYCRSKLYTVSLVSWHICLPYLSYYLLIVSM